MGKATVKKTAPAPKAAAAPKKKSSGQGFAAQHPQLFSKDANNFRVGRDIQPKRDLSRFVKWPKYVRLQRQRAILNKRLKVPPAINQFTRTLDKNLAQNVFKLFAHYRPESKEEKNKRRKEAAAAVVKAEKPADAKDPNAKAAKAAKPAKAAAAKSKDGKKPLFVKYGINHITTLIEEKKAKLVVIAHDVDPIELVVWLPALCRKQDIPFCIVKGKARLGQVVHKKTATALAITEVKPEHSHQLDQIVSAVRPLYNEDAKALKTWGGGIMGPKAQAVVRLREKKLAKEAKAKIL
jgi:large subunit ribosomal protein L7Ae